MPIIQEPNGMQGMSSFPQPDAQNLGGQRSEGSSSGNPVGNILRRFGIGGNNNEDQTAPPPPPVPTMQQGASEGAASPDFATRLGLDEGTDKAGVAAPFVGESGVPVKNDSLVTPESVAQPPTLSQEPPQMQATGDLGTNATEGSIPSIGEPTIGSSSLGIAEAPAGTTPDIGGETIGPEVQESLTKPAFDTNTEGEGATYDKLKVDLLEELRKNLASADEAIKGAKEAAGKLGIESSDVSANTSGSPPAEALKEPEPVGA